MAEAEIARLARRVRDEPRSTAFVALADALRRDGRFGEGLQVLREGFRVHPDHPPARVVLGRIHLEMGNRPLASEVLAEVVQSEPENLAATSLLARILVEDGRVAEARPLIDRMRMANVPDATLRELVRASESSDEPPPRGADPFDHPSVADRFVRAGHYHRALALWRRLATHHPTSATVRAHLHALERAMGGMGDVSGEAPSSGPSLPGLGEAFAALVEDGERPGAVAPRGRHRLARYARPFWRSP